MLIDTRFTNLFVCIKAINIQSRGKWPDQALPKFDFFTELSVKNELIYYWM